jgi:secreted Zn-dependent insulinase-like peptidase
LQICSAILLELWYLILKDALEPILGAAVSAGINYNVKPTPYGLMFAVYSWNSKLPDVVEIILREVAKFGSDVNIDLFKKFKKGWLKHMAAVIKDEYLSNYTIAR